MRINILKVTGAALLLSAAAATGCLALTSGTATAATTGATHYAAVARPAAMQAADATPAPQTTQPAGTDGNDPWD